MESKYFLSSKETEKLCQRLANGEEANTEVSYAIDANYYKGGGCESFLDKSRRQLVISDSGAGRTLRVQDFSSSLRVGGDVQWVATEKPKENKS